MVYGGGAGAEVRLSRSLENDCEGGGLVVDGAGWEEKLPKSPKPELDGCFWWNCCDGGCAGLVSKKLPPPRFPKAFPLLAAGGERVLAAVPKLAKGSTAAGLGLVVLPMLRLLNASSIPPKEPCC